MRTANNTNNYTVEGLVAKYRNFVKENTPDWQWKLFKEFDFSNDMTTELWKLDHDLFYSSSSKIDTPEEKLNHKAEIISGIDQCYSGSSADREFIDIVIDRLVCGHGNKRKLRDYVNQHMIKSNADIQLIAILYRDVAKERSNSYAIEVLSPYIEHFNKDAFDKEEMVFLCNHFMEVVSYEFSHEKDWVGTTMEELFFDTGVPETRLSSELKEYLSGIKQTQQGKAICIADGLDINDFALIFPEAIFTGPGFGGTTFALNQVRLFAESGTTVKLIRFSDYIAPQKNTVDFIIFDAMRYAYDSYTNFKFEEVIEPLYDSLVEGGKMLLLMTREGLMSHLLYKYRDNQMVEFYHRLVNERAIESMVLFGNDFHVSPAGWISFVGYFSMTNDQDNILICIEKKKHSKVHVESRKRKEVAIVDANSLDGELLYPGYYLANRPVNGCPISSLAKLDNDRVGSASDNALVVTLQHLSESYQNANVSIKSLSPKTLYQGSGGVKAVDKRGVLLYVYEQKLFIGYIFSRTKNKYARPENVPYLIPEKGIDVRYFAALLLSPEVKHQIISFCDGEIYDDFLSLFFDKIIVPKHTPKERLAFLSDVNYEALMSTQEEMKKNYDDYKKAVRLRKHALTQSLSSIEAMFYSLNACRIRQKGKLEDNDVISRLRGTTAKEAFEYVEPNLSNMMVTLEHIADVEYSFKKPEWIDPERFIEDYIAKHESGWLNFKPIITWSAGQNTYHDDITDPITGEVVVKRKGNVIWSLLFPKDALERIFNNIISNAKAHAFTDETRKDYKLRFSFYSDGVSLVVMIENNGTPIPADRDATSLLEYGVSSKLHQDGHNGIGCNEIDDIMRRYDGKVEIVSAPNEEFTVKYILSFKSNINLNKDEKL